MILNGKKSKKHVVVSSVIGQHYKRLIDFYWLYVISIFMLHACSDKDSGKNQYTALEKRWSDSLSCPCSAHALPLAHAEKCVGP